MSLATLLDVSHFRFSLAVLFSLTVVACSEPDGPNKSEGGGGSGGLTAGTGGSLNGGAGGEAGGGGQVDPEELCAASTSMDDCGGVDLPPLVGCADCWQACSWVSLHEVALLDGECSFGNTKSRCEHVTGGEGDVATLNDVCRSFGETYGNVVYEEAEEGLSIGFLPEGGSAKLLSCGQRDSPAECACACDSESPDAVCVEFGQAFRSNVPSGVVECPGVPIHRAAEVECQENVGECVTDDDCESGEACLCAHTGGRVAESVCVLADCKTNEDCAKTEVCAVSFSGEAESCGATHLACQTAHEKCDGVQCDTLELCSFNKQTEAFACVDAGACY